MIHTHGNSDDFYSPVTRLDHSSVEYTPRSRLMEDPIYPTEQHRRQNSNEASRRSPALARLINRTSFKRDSAVRRSLGGTAIPPPSWLNDDDPTSLFTALDRPNVTLISQTPTAPPSVPSRQPRSSLDLAPLLHIRVVRLPTLDDLGFALDSYSHPHTGQFLGLRLCDRFQNRKFHFDARDNCPFEPGDLIVSVNQHRLSSMHESHAIRYVYQAFRDARQYTVEFGVFRLPLTRDDEASHESHVASKPCYEPSTLPTRSSHKKRYSTACLLEPITTSCEPHMIEVNQHQPRRVAVPTRSPITRESHVPQASQPRPDHLEIPSSRPPMIIGISPDSSSTLSADRHSSTTRPDSTYRSDRCDTLTKPTRLEGDLTTTRPPLAVRSSLRITTDMPGSSISPGSPSLYRRSFSGTTLKDVNAFNTRAIGQRISIELTKLSDGGLGFTLTRRDTQTDPVGNDPVYVKKILPTGAAIRDGRLLVGDRLLSVDGVDVCNLDQVLAQLRAVLPGQSVRLVVSRQSATPSDDTMSVRKSLLPSGSQSPREPDLNSVDLPPRPYRSFTYEFRIPSAPAIDSPKPTLGVNFKWCTCPPDNDQLQSTAYAPLPGLYVESLLPEGIVVQSERRTLQPGDRLVGLNGESLEGLSAKEISLKIKKVLNGTDDSRMERPPMGASLPSSRRFSLTVHRYRGILRRRTLIDSEDVRSSQNPATPDYSNGPLLTDTRHRYSGSQERTEELLDSSGERLRHGGNSPRHLSVPPRILSGSNPHFEREGFGRRSVSEKRHAHVDVTQYPFFQSQILPSRYKMPEDVDKQYSTMPTTRRLKIQRERMAAAAAAAAQPGSGIAGSGGPIKALHPTTTMDSGRPSDPGIFHSVALSSVDQPSRDESASVRDPSASLFRRGRKQNSSFRNAVDRSLTMNSSAAVATSSLETDHPAVRSRSATRVPSNHPLPTTSSLASTSSRIQPVMDCIPTKSDATDSLVMPRPSTPVSMHVAAPPVPARMHTPESVKPPKRNFGGIRGLFKFVSGKSSQLDKPTEDRSGKVIPAPIQRRLSVPECQLPPSSSITNTQMPIANRDSRTVAAPSSTRTSSKPSPMQIPFRDTYYILRSPTKSNETFVTERSPRSSNSPSRIKHTQAYSHINPQSKTMQHPKMHRVAEWQANLPISPLSDSNNSNMIPTPPVPPRPHRSVPQIPISSSPKSARHRESTNTPKHNGHKSSSAVVSSPHQQHRSGRSNPEPSRLSGTQVRSDPRVYPQTVSAYPYQSPVLTAKHWQSVDVPHRNPSHRSPRQAISVSNSNPDRIYENNRLQYVTQRKSDSHSVRSRKSSTKHPISPSKRPHSAVTSPVVVAKPLAATVSTTHESFHFKRRTADLNVSYPDAFVASSSPRNLTLSPSDGRQTSQFVNTTHHRRRKSQGRNGQ